MNENAGKAIRLIVIIAVSATIGIILGHLVSNYELRFMISREYRGEVNGVEIYCAGDVNEDNLALHELMLERAPSKLAECCERIYFTGEDPGLPAADAGIGTALGLTQDRTVYISTQDFSTYVVFHELFHAYDNANGEISSNSVPFIRAYNANRGSIPVFASHTSAYPSEFFAQAGAMYLLIPDKLEISAPETYKFFSETLGFGESDALPEE
ncbi:MAG: hypothetical protein IK990_07910 [Ruminiclostridium sp.]|nr:hypothetical protein [Ruminiclostridium sp.]